VVSLVVGVVVVVDSPLSQLPQPTAKVSSVAPPNRATVVLTCDFIQYLTLGCPRQVPERCRPKTRHADSSSAPAVISATTLTTSRATYQRCARDRPGEHRIGAPAQSGPNSQNLDKQRCGGGGRRGRRAGRGRRHHEREGDDDRQHPFAEVQSAKDQPADTQADRHGDARGAELQRRFDERDGKDHSQPEEQCCGGDSGAGMHSWSLRWHR
jgi:hypothetical protein